MRSLLVVFPFGEPFAYRVIENFGERKTQRKTWENPENLRNRGKIWEIQWKNHNIWKNCGKLMEGAWQIYMNNTKKSGRSDGKFRTTWSFSTFSTELSWVYHCFPKFLSFSQFFIECSNKFYNEFFRAYLLTKFTQWQSFFIVTNFWTFLISFIFFS